MRFEKPAGVKDRPLQQSKASDDIEDVPYCIPADGQYIRGCQWDTDRQCCFRDNCDALFTPAWLRQQQQSWPKPQHPRVIIAAGPERSGSTFLYNALRLLYQHAERPVDCFWVPEVTEKAINDRLAGGNDVLIKTHAWSNRFDPASVSHIFVTHRDLRQVLASYRRMDWEYELPSNYVADHMKWRQHAELDIAFEDIISQPKQVLLDLAQRLGLDGLTDIKAVLHDVSNLHVPTDWVDPVTQIWPSHISSPYIEAREAVALAGANGEEEHLADAMNIGMEPETYTSTGSGLFLSLYPGACCGV